MTLEELINLTPEQLQAISDTELKITLEPYIGAVRKPLLPPEKASKITPQERLMTQILKDNADVIKKYKEQRNK